MKSDKEKIPYAFGEITGVHGHRIDHIPNFERKTNNLASTSFDKKFHSSSPPVSKFFSSGPFLIIKRCNLLKIKDEIILIGIIGGDAVYTAL
jgi:hypothetical protein